MSLPVAICVMGPTAAGKTAAAFALADEFPVDIISVDSAQVYRGMDIGTAKPDRATLERYPHRLIDILDPAERYSAAQFREDALREMESITGAGRIPLLVGGTGLYFRALLEGLSDLPEADEATRAAIEADAADRGWAVMHTELAEVDPETAARISPNDPQRIQRALEVHRLTGTPMSAQLGQKSAAPAPYRFLKFGIAPADRAELHRRIESRFNEMMAAGFLDEVRRLHERGDLHPDLPSIRAVGYRQLWSHLDAEFDRAESIRQGIVASRRYAKRQLTWFRKEPELRWLDSTEAGHVETLLSQVKKALD